MRRRDSPKLERLAWDKFLGRVERGYCSTALRLIAEARGQSRPLAHRGTIFSKAKGNFSLNIFRTLHFVRGNAGGKNIIGSEITMDKTQCDCFVTNHTSLWRANQ